MARLQRLAVRFLNCVHWRTSLALVLVLGTAVAQQAATMTWLIMDLPPAMILQDGRPVDGIADQRLKLIMVHMPGVMHEFQVMSTARILETLSQPNARACFNNAIFTPERERRFYLSATNLSFPLSVVAKPETLAKLSRNANGEVLPAALFDRTDLVGVVSAGRSYSALYDALLERRNPQAPLRFSQSVRGGVSNLQMLVSKQADYTIEYEYTLRYLMDTEPTLKGASLQALPLAGLVLNKSGVMCPRNAWGYEMIKKVDAIVFNLLPNRMFQNQTNQWVSPKMSAYLKPQVDAFYAWRQRTPSVYQPP